jgi:hypothetical protein
MQEIREAVIALCNEVSKVLPCDYANFENQNPEFSHADKLQMALHISHFNLAQNKTLTDLLAKSLIFSDAPNKAGYSGQPEAIIMRIIKDGAIMSTEGKWMVDSQKAIYALDEFKTLLESDKIEYFGLVRILGLIPEHNDMIINSDISLVSPSSDLLEQIDSKWPTFMLHSAISEKALAKHTSEFRIRVCIPIDTKVEAPLLFPFFNEASIQIREIGKNLLTAVRLTRSEPIFLGPTAITDPVSSMTYLSPGELLPLPIVTSTTLYDRDLEPLKEAFNLVNKINREQETLSRALQRFVFARQREGLYDSIVDYAIALESILLTAKGKSMNQELSYRFTLNGSSLIYLCPALKIERRIGYNHLKCFYDKRSNIVHGSSLKDLDKFAKKHGFNSLLEVAQTMDTYLREIIQYLGKMDPENRPYKKEGFWEDLLWNTEPPDSV